MTLKQARYLALRRYRAILRYAEGGRWRKAEELQHGFRSDCSFCAYRNDVIVRCSECSE